MIRFQREWLGRSSSARQLSRWEASSTSAPELRRKLSTDSLRRGVPLSLGLPIRKDHNLKHVEDQDLGKQRRQSLNIQLSRWLSSPELRNSKHETISRTRARTVTRNRTPPTLLNKSLESTTRTDHQAITNENKKDSSANAVWSNVTVLKLSQRRDRQMLPEFTNLTVKSTAQEQQDIRPSSLFRNDPSPFGTIQSYESLAGRDYIGLPTSTNLLGRVSSMDNAPILPSRRSKISGISNAGTCSTSCRGQDIQDLTVNRNV